jgi:hypothetical protein
MQSLVALSEIKVLDLSFNSIAAGPCPMLKYSELVNQHSKNNIV